MPSKFELKTTPEAPASVLWIYFLGDSWEARMLQNFLWSQLRDPNPIEILFAISTIALVIFSAVVDSKKWGVPGKAARNEVRKLQASFLNTLSLGIIAVMAIGPATTGVFHVHTFFSYVIRDVYALLFTGMLLLAMQTVAWRILRKIED